MPYSPVNVMEKMEKMMLKAIFWDNDGVLVDTERLYFEANRIFFSMFGVDLTKELYIENYLKNNSGCWHLLPEDIRGMVDDLRSERNRIYKDFIKSEDICINGAGDVLSALHGKLMMAAVSSSRKDHFDLIHSRTGFGKYFDFTVVREDCIKSKPDPEPYLKAIEKSGFQSSECIVVEDSARGLMSATAAGIKCWVIPTELTSDSDFSGADRILSSISEIPGLLGF